MIQKASLSTQIGTLQSLQVGTPTEYSIPEATGAQERTWETSFFRVPDARPRWLYTTHLDGNAQADTKNHGQITQAVLLYAAAHYPLWRAELHVQEIGPGGFGENLTLAGLSEETTCVGDIYGIDEARLQVTGPRFPCWKIEQRWGIEGLTARVAESGRTGWYCRVLEEGMIEPGAPLMLIERSYPQWTIALVNDFAHYRNRDVKKARELADCPLLAGFWPQLIVRRAMGQE
jgi:MOSC domain-containing protein YiiM